MSGMSIAAAWITACLGAAGPGSDGPEEANEAACECCCCGADGAAACAQARVEPAVAPDGEAPTLNAIESVDEFAQKFDEDAGRPRLVALLSPTCAHCVAGARAIESHVLEAFPDADLRVLAVWLPMLSGDDEGAARRAAAIFGGGGRVTQFYDGGHALANALSEQLLKEGTGPAWDIYLFYGMEAEWGDAPPRPVDWIHQLGGTRRADPQRFRTGRALAEALKRMAGELLDENARAESGALEVELLWFGECPNQKKMRGAARDAIALLDVEVEWRETDLEALAADDARRRFGSPTLLVNGEDLFGASPGAAGALSCRVYPGGTPDAAEIEKRLRGRMGEREETPVR